MDQNKKQPEAFTNYIVDRGLVSYVSIIGPVSKDNILYESNEYSLKDDGNFEKVTYSIHKRPDGSISLNDQVKIKTSSVPHEQLTKEVVDFELKQKNNGSKLMVFESRDLKTDHANVSYQTLCETLEKSEAIHHAAGLTSHGASVSSGTTHSGSHNICSPKQGHLKN